jgi:glycosyltransferase involved in cell wall biosynthesis
VAQRRIRVLLDARKLGDGGIGVYLENLIQGLSQDPSITLKLLVRSDPPGNLPDVEILRSDVRPYSFREYALLAKVIDSAGCDLYHSPHYTLPFGLRTPAIVTVHDVIHISHPERWYYPPIARFLIGHAIRRSAGVICVSQATHARLRAIGLLAKHTAIIGNAVPRAFESQAIAPPAKRAGHLLCVLSNVKPHKGVRDLLEAYEQCGHEGSVPDLILTGLGTAKIEREFGVRLARLDGVHCTGPVSERDLVELFRSAAGVVIPSLEEGFCLSALQAHAVGVPFIARPVPAILELATPSDSIAENFNVGALAAALRRFLDRKGGFSPETLRSMASAMSIEATSTATADFYRQVILSSENHA